MSQPRSSFLSGTATSRSRTALALPGPNRSSQGRHPDLNGDALAWFARRARLVRASGPNWTFPNVPCSRCAPGTVPPVIDAPRGSCRCVR